MIRIDFIYWKGVSLLSYMKENYKKRGVIMKMNWTEVKEKIRPQISKPSYETWFTNTTVYLEDDI